MISMNSIYPKKKILFFMTALHVGGGEKVSVDLMNHFVENGNEIILVLMKEKNYSIYALSKDIRIVNLSVPTFLSAIRKLIGVLKIEKPDVVYASSPHANVSILLALFLSGIKARSVIRVGSPLSVIFEHYSSFKDKYILLFLTKVLYKRADFVIAVSKGIAADTQLVAGVRKNKIYVVYNPKDIDSIRKKADEYVPDVFKKNEGPFLLFVGRLVDQKDPLTLVRTFVEFLKKHKAHLIIVGDGSLNKKVFDLVMDLGIVENVSFEGVKENPYVYMKNADVLVLTSLLEGLPNVLIESLVCGKPFVSTDCPAGGPREIAEISGLQECLAPVGDSQTLARVIQLTLEKKQTSFNVEKFSQEIPLEQYDDLFLNPNSSRVDSV